MSRGGEGKTKEVAGEVGGLEGRLRDISRCFHVLYVTS
jgi:hypothetical protein